MSQFLPDEESMTEIFGAHMARGMRFEFEPAPYFHGYALKVRMGAGSDVVPMLPLPEDEMQTPEDARAWLEHLRDTMMGRFMRTIEL
ncbi:hypothetical protein [Hymenobacter algoricola]|uniref:Uncharacterized protein n=1 Tax=Hymenobacter algoricola TaxID=486267 RepID=A0ABP7MHG2_9BACT